MAIDISRQVSKGGNVSKNIKVNVTGAELDEALGKIVWELRSKVAKKAVRNACKIVQKEMKRMAPKQTGELRKSIKVRVRDYPDYTMGLIGPADVTEQQAKKNNALEYGSEKLGIAPRGYVRGAGDNTKNQVEAAMIAAIQAEIGK